MKEPKQYKYFIDYDNDMPDDTTLSELQECKRYHDYLKSQKGRVVQLPKK